MRRQLKYDAGMARWFSPGPHLCALAALLLLLCPSQARGQTRLYLLFAGDPPPCPPLNCDPPRVLEIDVDGRRVLADTPVLHARESAAPPVVTPDGRYVAWMGSENHTNAPTYLSVFDTASRWQTSLLQTSVQGLQGALFADPTAVRLFSQFQYGSLVTVVEPQGYRALPALA